MSCKGEEDVSTVERRVCMGSESLCLNVGFRLLICIDGFIWQEYFALIFKKTRACLSTPENTLDENKQNNTRWRKLQTSLTWNSQISSFIEWQSKRMNCTLFLIEYQKFLLFYVRNDFILFFKYHPSSKKRPLFARMFPAPAPISTALPLSLSFSIKKKKIKK